MKATLTDAIVTIRAACCPRSRMQQHVDSTDRQTQTMAKSRASEGSTPREVVRLAVPAFFALVAEPAFLLVDSAIVGHLGATPLAGLAIASTILVTAVGICVFLAYGTTAVVARQIGAGDRAGAITAGIDGSWLALILGATIGTIVGFGARPLAAAFGPPPQVLEQAVTYLRVSAAGIPAMLIVLAATGVLRGMLDTRTPLAVSVVGFSVNAALNYALVYGLGWGIAGSAWGTVVAQWLMAAALATVVIRYAARLRVPLRTHPARVLAAAVSGIPLLVRTVALRAILVLTAWVATGLGEVTLAAHQVALTVWIFVTFAFDAIAIAAQALTGQSLGAGDARAARDATTLMVRWGMIAGGVALILIILVRPWLPALFTPDENVQTVLATALSVVALSMPATAIFCVLDGVLIGAGDTRWLAWSMVALLAAYVPIALGIRWVRPVLVGDDPTSVTGQSNGILWLWLAFTALMSVRAAVLWLRARTDRWMRLGRSAV